MMTPNSPKNTKKPVSAKNTGKNRKRKRRLTRKGKIALTVAVLVIVLCISLLFMRQPSVAERLSLTYLDSLTLSDLNSKPQESYADKTRVGDYTIYGTSLVFYDQTYSPLETDGYFGRNVKLVNIKTGEEITTTFTGGGDSGIDLQNLPAGVYEVYLTNGYTYARAYSDEEMHSSPLITMRNDKKVCSVQVDASKDYLDKFSIDTDENYIFLTVTESLPIVKVTDVVIDPSGYLVDPNGMPLEWYSEGSFDESEHSWEFAQRIARYLESAGLRVTFSRDKEELKGYAGENSRAGIGYSSQAKIFLSLTMSDAEQPYPYMISSPFTNGVLGNSISSALLSDGILLSTPVVSSQLNIGNTYDQLTVDEAYELEPYSLFPALRETGGRLTSAGQSEQWKANEMFSQSYGMNSLVFCYASSQNEASRTYFLENEDTLARGIAQGILNACGYSITLDENSISHEEESHSQTTASQSAAAASSDSPEDTPFE